MKKISFLIFFTTLLLSCNNSDDTSLVESPYVPSATALKNLFDTNLNAIKQTGTFSSSGMFTFTSSAGATVNIDGTCLRKNGLPVTGNVDVEYIEIFDRGTMLLTNKSTMGQDINGDFVAMESGGEVLVKVKQNGVELTTICDYEIKMPASNTGGVKPGMAPFYGTINPAGDISWTTATVSEFYVTTSPDKYNVLLGDFKWFNYDKLPATGPRTTITVNIPSQYVNASTVFLSTNAKPNSLGGIVGKWNIGLQCNIIFLAEENGNFRYAIKPITVINNQVVTFNTSETAIATPAQMKTILNNLP